MFRFCRRGFPLLQNHDQQFDRTGKALFCRHSGRAPRRLPLSEPMAATGGSSRRGVGSAILSLCQLCQRPWRHILPRWRRRGGRTARLVTILPLSLGTTARQGRLCPSTAISVMSLAIQVRDPARAARAVDAYSLRSGFLTKAAKAGTSLPKMQEMLRYSITMPVRAFCCGTAVTWGKHFFLIASRRNIPMCNDRKLSSRNISQCSVQNRMRQAVHQRQHAVGIDRSVAQDNRRGRSLSYRQIGNVFALQMLH